jgi:hypothetical protein
MEFCNLVLQMLKRNDMFIERLIISDEAHIMVTGYVKILISSASHFCRMNVHIWYGISWAGVIEPCPTHSWYSCYSDICVISVNDK